jgi:hypothetical protein
MCACCYEVQHNVVAVHDMRAEQLTGLGGVIQTGSMNAAFLILPLHSLFQPFPILPLHQRFLTHVFRSTAKADRDVLATLLRV